MGGCKSWHWPVERNLEKNNYTEGREGEILHSNFGAEKARFVLRFPKILLHIHNCFVSRMQHGGHDHEAGTEATGKWPSPAIYKIANS
jgi:hypothetical protein